MSQIGVFAPDDAKLVAKAAKQVLTEFDVDSERDFAPFVTQPVYRVKITGAVDGQGMYPGKLMRRHPTTRAWIEMGDCYAEKVDTI